MIWGNDFHYTKNQRSREPKIEDQGDKGSRGRRIEGTKENIWVKWCAEFYISRKNIKVWRVEGCLVEGCLNSIVIFVCFMFYYFVTLLYWSLSLFNSCYFYINNLIYVITILTFCYYNVCLFCVLCSTNL